MMTISLSILLFPLSYYLAKVVQQDVVESKGNDWNYEVVPAFGRVDKNYDYQQAIAHEERLDKFLQRLTLVEHSVLDFAANIGVAHYEL